MGSVTDRIAKKIVSSGGSKVVDLASWREGRKMVLEAGLGDDGSARGKLAGHDPCYAGREGQIWFARVLPPPNRLCRDHIVFNTPYVVRRRRIGSGRLRGTRPAARRIRQERVERTGSGTRILNVDCCLNAFEFGSMELHSIRLRFRIAG